MHIWFFVFLFILANLTPVGAPILTLGVEGCPATLLCLFHLLLAIFVTILDLSFVFEWNA